MRAKSKKALRRSAQFNSRVVALPTTLWRRPGVRIGTANGVAAAVAGILWGSAGTASAQEAAPTVTPASESVETVVVTASATGGTKKLDASYNIVAVDADEIKLANPKSTADLLKVSPGIWPESSGGQTGANIEVAGFPSGGDAPFFTNMIEGSPLYGMPSLSFMDSSSLFRIDDTIERVEVVQGGPSSVFGPAQIGAQANFILRRGTAKPTGEVGFTYGNEGLYRVDAFYGFQFADGWYASAGGFYRGSDGVRSPQFKADLGGQFTVTISHDLDDGSLMFWARTTQEKNQFIVPIPVIQTGTDTFSAYPGFSPLTSSYGSKAIQNVVLPNPAGGFEGADLANGRGANLYYFGSAYNQRFGKWSVINHFLWDGGDLPTNALFSGPNPRPLSYYLYGCQTPQSAGYCNGATAVDTNNLGPGGQGLPLSYNISPVYAGTGQAVPLNQSVIQQGWWYIQKTLRSITDEFRVSNEIFAGNTLTLGIYGATYMDDDNWSLGNQMLMANTPNATAIALSYLTGADCKTPGSINVCHLTSPQGFVNLNGNYNIEQHGDAWNLAAFFSDSWRINKWLVDVGARIEEIDVTWRGCGTNTPSKTTAQLGTVFDLWANKVPVCTYNYEYEKYIKSYPTYTGGANYEFTDHMSAYVRANTGVHYNDFDNTIRGSNGNPSPLQTVTNYEGGFKFQTTWMYIDISAYHRDFTGLTYQPTNGLGTPVGPPGIYGSTAKGVDLVGVVTPLRNFSIRIVGDYMDGTYKDLNKCQPYTDIFGRPGCAQFNGQPLQRQPKVQFRITPQYVYPFNWGDLTAWVTYEYVGQRYQDQTGQTPLGAYDMWSAGIVANVGRNWQFRVQGTNLSHTVALTEGNARITGTGLGIGGVLLARPIEGQEINFTAKYLW